MVKDLDSGGILQDDKEINRPYLMIIQQNTKNKEHI